MKIIHAVIALLLSALLLGIVAGVATADIAVNAPNIPAQEGRGPVTAVVTHRDLSTPSTYYVDPMESKASMGTINPSVTVMPTKVKRYNKVGGGELRIKPSPTVKYVQLLGQKSTPVPTVNATASPVPTKRIDSPAMTPAQSYGISGLGDTPYFNKTTPSPLAPRTSTAGTSGKVSLSSDSRNAGRGPGFGGSYAGQATVTPITYTVPYVPKISINPTASPTPVPGGYTPRFPGEPGYKGSPTPPVKATVTVTPTVTVKPTVTTKPVARR